MTIAIEEGERTSEGASGAIAIQSTLIVGPKVQKTTLVEGLGAASEVESSLPMLAAVAAFIIRKVLAATGRLLNSYRKSISRGQLG